MSNGLFKLLNTTKSKTKNLLNTRNFTITCTCDNTIVAIFAAQERQKNKFLFHGAYHLTEIQVKDVPDTDSVIKNCFLLLFLDGFGQVRRFKCVKTATPYEKEDWLRHLGAFWKAIKTNVNIKERCYHLSVITTSRSVLNAADTSTIPTARALAPKTTPTLPIATLPIQDARWWCFLAYTPFYHAPYHAPLKTPP